MKEMKIITATQRQAALERLRTRRLNAYTPTMQQRIIDAGKCNALQVTEPTSTGNEIKPGK